MKATSILIWCVALFSISCNRDPVSNKEFKIMKDDALYSVKPRKPARVQLKRNTKGEYSWDIKGDDIDQVLEADSKLKKSILKKDKEEER